MAAQWLRLLPLQGVQVQSLVGDAMMCDEFFIITILQNKIKFIRKQ